MRARKKQFPISNWFLEIAIIISLLSVIITGLQALYDPTSEEGLTNMRRTVIGIVTGLIFLILRFVLSALFGTGGTPDSLIMSVAALVSQLLGYVTLGCLVILIYGGVLLVTSEGEDRATKARGIIIRSLLGIVVIGGAYALSLFVVSAAS